MLVEQVAEDQVGMTVLIIAHIKRHCEALSWKECGSLDLRCFQNMIGIFLFSSKEDIGLNLPCMHCMWCANGLLGCFCKNQYTGSQLDVFIPIDVVDDLQVGPTPHCHEGQLVPSSMQIFLPKFKLPFQKEFVF